MVPKLLDKQLINFSVKIAEVLPDGGAPQQGRLYRRPQG